MKREYDGREQLLSYAFLWHSTPKGFMFWYMWATDFEEFDFATIADMLNK